MMRKLAGGGIAVLVSTAFAAFVAASPAASAPSQATLTYLAGSDTLIYEAPAGTSSDIVVDSDNDTVGLEDLGTDVGANGVDVNGSDFPTHTFTAVNDDDVHVAVESKQANPVATFIVKTYDRDDVILVGDATGLDPDVQLVVYAGRGPDEVDGSGEDNIVFGGAGRDLIAGGQGTDTLKGGYGEDGIRGQDGDDTITGGPQADTLRGGYDDDTFHAVDGYKDVIVGGAGADDAFANSFDIVYSAVRM